jgi:alkylation response protein AidB-like acyl-CoA dehydrogenase
MSGEALSRFRDEVRGWLAENCPPLMRTPSEGDEGDVWGGRRATFAHPEQKLWLERMVARGFTAPTWPREYGGAGLSRDEARVLGEELRRIGARIALKSFGIWMLGPVLLQHGTDEQKRAHLPPIARGETRWCQGYSEPGAGSDLASLTTSAVRDRDAYVVNGQKVWTSHADRADWIFCLVRTDPATKGRDGISFLLVDMASPGVSVRPIRLISGASPFCETFFHDVRVPVANRVGPEHGGWTIAKALLEHERAAISALRDAAVADETPLEELARRYAGTISDGEGAARIADPVLRDRIAQANLDYLANQLTLRRAAEAAAVGLPPGPEASLFKYYGTELNKRRRELRVLCAGFRGLGWEGAPFSAEELRATRDWLRSRANSIEGGTSEIQLNIIARRVLGLPD